MFKSMMLNDHIEMCVSQYRHSQMNYHNVKIHLLFDRNNFNNEDFFNTKKYASDKNVKFEHLKVLYFIERKNRQ